MRNSAWTAALLCAALSTGVFYAPCQASANADVQAAEAAQKQVSAEESQTRQTIRLPKASPAYGKGYFYDALDARWETIKSFPYGPDNVYKIYCQPGFVTDIALHEGDTLTYAGAGDTARWMIDQAMSGGAPHVYIKPVQEGIQTNLILNTDRHSYQLQLVAGDWHLPIVRWSYQVEQAIAAERESEKEQTRKTKQQLRWKKNYRYKIKPQGGKAPKWTPKKVYDDGEKTVVEFGDLKEEMPVLFVLNGADMQPANYRVRGNTFVVDGVFKRAVLRAADQATVVIINRGGDKS